MTELTPQLVAQVSPSDGARWIRGVLGAVTDIDRSWQIFGLAAEAVIALCIAAQWVATHREGRFVIYPWMVYIAIAATLMLAVYAWMIQEWVFLLGQVLFVLIELRVLGWSSEMRSHARPGDSPRLPVVAPDSAELKLPLKDPPSGIKPSSRVTR